MSITSDYLRFLLKEDNLEELVFHFDKSYNEMFDNLANSLSNKNINVNNSKDVLCLCFGYIHGNIQNKNEDYIESLNILKTHTDDDTINYNIESHKCYHEKMALMLSNGKNIVH